MGWYSIPPVFRPCKISPNDWHIRHYYYRTVSTDNKGDINYGIRDNPFPESIDQLSAGLTMQRNLTLFSRQFTLLSDVVLDSGDLFDTQVGLSMGLRWYP